MSKFLKHIPVLFLWFAGLAINAHMIIPHDHHLTESLASQDDSCPASESRPGHHTGFPVHCHACNDLTSEKATTFVKIKHIQVKNFVISRFTDQLTCKLHFLCVSFNDLLNPFPDSHLLEFSSLRAPPSVI